MDNQSTIIYIENNEDDRAGLFGGNVLGIEYTSESVAYIFSFAREFVQEALSNVDEDIRKYGYRTLDDDCGIHIRGTVVFLTVRMMTDDEIEKYEDTRERQADAAAADDEWDRRCDEARYPNE